MRKALADRQGALGRFQVVLPEIRNELAERLVEGDTALFDEPQDRGRREDDFRQRGEIEHRLAPHGDFRRLKLRAACDQDGALTGLVHQSKNSARNARLRNRTADGFERAIGDLLQRHVWLTRLRRARRRRRGGLPRCWPCRPPRCRP